MVRVIMGKKGSGKTKQMIELINAAVGNRARQRWSASSAMCLTYNIDYNIRLVEASDFDIKDFRVPEGHGLRSVRRQLRHYPCVYRLPLPRCSPTAAPGGFVPGLAGCLLEKEQHQVLPSPSPLTLSWLTKACASTSEITRYICKAVVIDHGFVFNLLY